MSAPLRAETLRDGAVERLILDRPKANLLDAAMIAALREHIAVLHDRPVLKLIVLEGAGPHFSFGASVEEHLPPQVADMLATFHALFREIEALGVPTAALVRGQCLGGGFELALSCGRIVCDATARFAVPEITLGVFPPLGSLLLPWRTGGTTATRLVLTGEAVGAEEALSLGAVDQLADDPEAALWAWYDEHLAPRSAVGLRHAWRAVRRPVARALADDLPALERLYLEELMAHRDPLEGLQAFLDKRPPAWSHA